MKAAVSIFTRTLARGVVDSVLNSPSRGEQASTRDQGAVLRALHRVLVEKLEKYLPKDPDEDVVIVPDGSLFLVPFAALLEADGTYLVERHAISVVPSLGMLGLPPQRAVRSNGKELAWVIAGHWKPIDARVSFGS